MVLERRDKIGPGNCLFLAGKMGFQILELRFISRKQQNGMGIKFEHDSNWDGRTCALRKWDLVKNCAGKIVMDIFKPNFGKGLVRKNIDSYCSLHNHRPLAKCWHCCLH